MTLNYYNTDHISDLVEEIFCLSIRKEDLPFESKIIPLGFTTITYIYGKNQKAIHNKKSVSLDNLILTGHFLSAYLMKVASEGDSFGMNFHPTGLHKLTGLDISKFTNKHQYFKKETHKIAEPLNQIFTSHKGNWDDLCHALKNFISSLPLYNSDKVAMIDHTVNFIELNEGMVSVNDVLDEVSFSQKTLETHFKKIVGITPGRFIRLHRFTKLMRKYESNEINIKDLIHQYDYYDRSHFSKDFKLFMNEYPTSYFQKDAPFIREYLKNR